MDDPSRRMTRLDGWSVSSINRANDFTSVCILTIKFNQWARVNFCIYRKNFCFKRISGQLNSKDFRRVMTRATRSERTSYHDFAKRNYWTSSERFTGVTYGFRFWIGSQSVGITFTIQFFQVQLDWSRRKSLASDRAYFLDSFSSMGWAKWLSRVWCMTFALLFNTIFLF